MRTKFARVFLLAAGVALIAAACGGESEATVDRTADTAPFSQSVTVINADSSDEGQTTLEELIDGDKPVLLWSFAAWCVNCKAEAPGIDAFAAANPDVQVIGIGARDTAEASVRFIQETGVENSTMVWAGNDEGSELWRQLGFTGRTENLVLSADLQQRTPPNRGGFDEAAVLEQIAAFS